MDFKYYLCLHDNTGVFAEAEFRDWSDIGTIMRAYNHKNDLVITISLVTPEEKEEES